MRFFSKDVIERIGFTLFVTGLGLMWFFIGHFTNRWFSHEGLLLMQDITSGIVIVAFIYFMAVYGYDEMKKADLDGADRSGEAKRPE
jgi:hypothetical protein